mmetsp:Transcript_3823/g.8598  ORF Transcript_3823/g.8598 Transcript_3823/m.8598 type:complete len:268 (-) Transcript_3823:80-883(-)
MRLLTCDAPPGYTFTALRMASRSSFFHASVRCTTMPIIFTITLSTPFSTKKSTNALCSTTGKQISSFALPSSIVLRITQDAPCARQRYGIVPRHQNQHGVSDTRDRLLERREPPVGRHLQPRALVDCEHVEPHVYAFPERLLRASTTSTNVYFHACDTNTVASCASSAFVLLSISAYDILTCSVAGLTIPKHTSFVVMSSKGMSAYCTLVQSVIRRHSCLRRSKRARCSSGSAVMICKTLSAPPSCSALRNSFSCSLNLLLRRRRRQ